MQLQPLIQGDSWRLQASTLFTSAQVLCRNCLSRRLAAAGNRSMSMSRGNWTNPSRSSRTRRQVRLCGQQTNGAEHANLIPSHAMGGRTLASLFFGSTMFIGQRHSLQFSRPFVSCVSAVLDKPQHEHSKNEPPLLVRRLRQSLHSSDPNVPDLTDKRTPRSRRVRKIIVRREQRDHVMALYRKIRMSRELLESLDSHDFNELITMFTPNPDNSRAAEILFDAVMILEDICALNSSQVPFTQDKAELLISFYQDLGNLSKTEQLLRSLIVSGQRPSEASYEALFKLLSENKNMDDVDAWLKTMQASGHWPPSDLALGYVVSGWANMGREDKAIEALKNYSGAIQRALVDGSDSVQVIKAGLDAFETRCIRDWRLNDARFVYRLKRKLELETDQLVRRLVNKSLYTFQTSVTLDLLQDALKADDVQGTQRIARALIKWYLRRDEKQVMNVYEQVENIPGVIGPSEYELLLTMLAKSKKHVDLHRLYLQCRSRYPSEMTIDSYNATLHGLVKSKRYKLAVRVFEDIKQSIPITDINQSTFNSLYALCAQTGRVDLFEQILLLHTKSNTTPGHHALTSLMACYVVAKDPTAAKQMFSRIVDTTDGPDVVDYNLLIQATALEHCEPNLGRIFDILKHMTTMGIQPDETTFRTLLGIYGDSNIADQLLLKLLNDPHATKEDHIWLNNIALTAMLKKGRPDIAAKRFLNGDRGNLFKSRKGEAIDADEMTYKILLDGLTKFPKYMGIAQCVYNQVRSKGIKLNREMYERMILGWSRKGRQQRARAIVRDMEDDLKIVADERVYTMVIEGLLQRNKLAQAKEIIDQDIVQKNGTVDEFLLERLKQHKISKESSPSS